MAITRTKPPRILHIHVLPVISGSGINTFLTMKGLKHKYQMEMACAPGKGLNELVEENGMRVHHIKHFVSKVSLFKDLFALWQIYRLLRREKFDLIHTHNSKGGFIGRLAAHLAVRDTPVVHTVHGFAFHENETKFRRNIFLGLEKLLRNWCVKIICISEPLVKLCLSHNIAPIEKICKIYSGIDIKEFSKRDKRDKIRHELGLKRNEIAICQVSKLWEGKGHDDIIEACKEIFAQVPKSKVFFVGNGHIRKRLEYKVKARGFENKIIFLGHRADIPAVTSAMDIAVLAFHFEGMGRVVIEAMAAGLPVVASQVGGIVDLVDNEINGLLVPPHAPDHLARSIVRLAKDPNLRKRMGEMGRKKLDKRFSADTMIKQINKIYEKILYEHK